MTLAYMASSSSFAPSPLPLGLSADPSNGEASWSNILQDHGVPIEAVPTDDPVYSGLDDDIPAGSRDMARRLQRNILKRYRNHYCTQHTTTSNRDLLQKSHVHEMSKDQREAVLNEVKDHLYKEAGYIALPSAGLARLDAY